MPSVVLDYTFDSALRPAGYNVSGGGPSSALAYDNTGRLSTVTAANATHNHAYIPGTGVLSGLTTTAGSATIQTRALHHDLMGRLIGIQTTASGTVLSRHGYMMDGAGRRVRATRENGQRWDYAYDDLGQVTGAVKKFPDAEPIHGHAFSFAYDGIGNRTTATLGGTGTGVSYTANNLNQYTGIQTGGSRYILGEAPVTDTVTVNGDAASRAGGLGFYSARIDGDNSSGPLWSNDTVASNGTSISGHTWTPAANVAPSFDADGNLTNDGRWIYTWDAENRLVRMETTNAAITAGVPRQRLDFAYDSQSRRFSKKVSTSTDGQTWTVEKDSRFLYDGWNLIAEYSVQPSSIILQTSFAWGNDISGTPQGAGGVGGLLSVTLHDGTTTENAYPSYDGNGNISAWCNATGSLLARMDYSPFGQLIARYKLTPANDTTLDRLPFGFSTKYTDSESGLLYYGYRWYDPYTGRWINRDPIEEEGGVNLYMIGANDTVNRSDTLGLVHRPGGAVANIDQIPDIMDRLGNKVAAAAMRRWFARASSDTTDVDDILTMAWALEYQPVIAGFNFLLTAGSNPGGWRSKKAEEELKRIVNRSVSSGSFDFTSGKMSLQHKHHFQFVEIGKTSGANSDFAMAVSRSSLHVVAAGHVTRNEICVTKIGIYLRDQYDFQGDQPLKSGLGVWDFKEGSSPQFVGDFG